VLLIFSMASVGLLGFVPLMPLLWLHYPLYVALTSRIIGSWECWCALLLEKVYGIQCVLTGDRIDSTERSVVISNHRTRLDWAMLWPVLARSRATYALHVILKHDIKKIPLMGWATAMSRYIFLHRKWERDADHIDNMLQLIARQPSYALLIFPEGTDLNAKGLAASDAFAEKAGLPKYRQILHPRTKGFTEMVTTLRAQPAPLTVVYDFTLAYRGTIAQNEKMFAAGRVPHAMECHVNAYRSAELPGDRAGLDRWVQERFRLKEIALERYYADPTLTLPDALAVAEREVRSPNPAAVAGSSGGAAGSVVGGAAAAPAGSEPVVKPGPRSPTHNAAVHRGADMAAAAFPTAAYASSAAFSGVFMLLSVSLLYRHPLGLAAFLAAAWVAFYIVNAAFGGMDVLETRLHCTKRRAAADIPTPVAPVLQARPAAATAATKVE
jgi:1-acyl-sn-glycerol-3-phosphate acyltransferase